MKSLITANFNKLGLNTPEKKVRWAAKTLQGGTLPNPTQTIIKAAVPAVPAVAAIIGTGTAASPQTPAKAAIAAKPAIMSPVVTPQLQWFNSVTIDETSIAYDKITAYLPYSPAAIALGVPLTAAQIQEITPKGFYLGDWQGDITGIVPTTDPDLLIGGLPATVEQILYTYASQIPVVTGVTNKIAPALYKPNPAAPVTPVIALELYLGK